MPRRADGVVGPTRGGTPPAPGASRVRRPAVRGGGCGPAFRPDALRRTTLTVAARSARLEQAAAVVIAAADGIPVLVLKGLALQKLAYSAGTVRSMDDVDLLVSLTDSPRLGRLLRSRGYRNDLRGEEDFFAPDLSHSIDLHTDLVNTTRLPARGALWAEPFQDIWQRRQSFALGGATAWTLGPPDTIQHLAVHAVHHHGMQGALWMADLLAALQTWPDAVHAVRRAPAGVRRSVWYCLEALATRGQDPIYAKGFTDAGQPPQHTRLAYWANLARLAASRCLPW